MFSAWQTQVPHLTYNKIYWLNLTKGKGFFWNKLTYAYSHKMTKVEKCWESRLLPYPCIQTKNNSPWLYFLVSLIQQPTRISLAWKCNFLWETPFPNVLSAPEWKLSGSGGCYQWEEQSCQRWKLDHKERWMKKMLTLLSWYAGSLHCHCEM